MIWKRPWSCLLVFLVPFVLYVGILNNGFVWDDHPVVENNRQIRQVFPLTRFLSGEGPLKQRPLMSFSLAVDYSLWQQNLFGFHLTNLLLHALTSLAVCLIGLRLLRSAVPAFVAGLLFAVHPVHGEAVAALLGRSDLLATGSALVGLLFYTWSRSSRGPKSIPMYLLSLLLYLIACFSKETGVVLLGWLILYELLWVPKAEGSEASTPNGLTSRGNGLKALLRLLPFVLIAVGYLGFLRSVAGADLAKTGWWGGSFQSNLLMSFKVFWEYLRLLFFPLRLSPWYVVSVPQTVFEAKILLGLIAVLAFVVGIIFFRRRQPFLSFLLGWFLASFLPLSNIVPIAGSMMAERWLYPASVAFCLAVGLGWQKATAGLRSKPRLLFALAGLWLFSLLGLRTVAWIGVWRSDYTLFGEVLRQHPRIPKAHLWLADAYLQADSLIQAEQHFRTALALAPNDPKVHADLGILYGKQGRFEQAIQEYQIALRLGGEQPLPRMNLGATYERLGRYPEALIEYQKAISLGADMPGVLFRMGECYVMLGDSLQARQAFSRALRLDPTYHEAKERLTRLSR